MGGYCYCNSLQSYIKPRLLNPAFTCSGKVLRHPIFGVPSGKTPVQRFITLCIRSWQSGHSITIDVQTFSCVKS